MNEKEKNFRDLCKQVQNCHKCPDMEDRSHVLFETNGDLDAKIMFIAEAPGWRGCDRTMIPLYGDSTGDRFQELLGIQADPQHGWQNTKIFVTNAVLCNPRGENGGNKHPSPANCNNCQCYLKKTLEIINPEVVVCLGEVAAKALDKESPLMDQHRKQIATVKISELVGKELFWKDKKVYVVYHLSGYNYFRRSRQQQQQDWEPIRKLLK